jgi:peptidoglycan hydrolase-like protein with peptidoglycan-binding domain
MKDRKKVSIFNYLVSVIPFSFFNRKNFYRLLLCSSVPLLFGSPSVAYDIDGQQIAQVNTVGNINRPSLKVGSQGDAVSELQAALKLMGYYNGAVDGKFGETTATAVSQFKQSAGLEANGVVDTTTWQTLFPGQTTIANNSTEQTTSTTTTTKTNNFPVPNQTAANLPRPVVVSNQQSTTSTRRNTGNAQELETVRVATTRTTTNNSSNNNSRNNNSRQSARVQQSSTITSTNNRGRNTATNTTRISTNGVTNRGRSTNTATSTRNNTTTRRRTATNTSTYRTRQTDSNLQKPGIQYTAAGFPILRLGMRGEEVYDLQTRLQRLGYLKNGPDGDFGAGTEAAIKDLQQRFGLQPDGVAGGETWEILTRRRTNRSQS